MDCNIENDEVIFKNKLGFTFIFDSLNRKSKKELIKRLIENIEIKRDKNYNIEITNIKITEEFISKSSKDYIKYLYEILQNDIGFIYKEAITKEELEKLQEDYFVFSNTKIANGEYDKKEMYKHFDSLLKEINIEYRTTLVNLANYPLIMFAMAKIMEMDSDEQNRVALYLFNNIY